MTVPANYGTEYRTITIYTGKILVNKDFDTYI